MTSIEELRALLAEGRCLCSSADADWDGVAGLLDRLERAERQVAAVEALADECGSATDDAIRAALATED